MRHGLALRRVQRLGGGGHHGADARPVGHGVQLFLEVSPAHACQLRKTGGRIAFATGAMTGDTGGRAVRALRADLLAVGRALGGGRGGEQRAQDEHAG
ncbi:hypothetical protein D9M68_782670 [compost metagenome]